MVTNFQAAMLYKFLTSPVANTLNMTLKGNLAVQRNLRGLKDFFDSVVELEGKYKIPPEAYNEVERRKNELIMKYAVRDDDGNLVQVAGGFRVSEVEKFNKEFEELMSSSKDIIDDYNNKLKEWEDFANAETDVTVVMVKEEDVKFDKLSKQDFEALLVMIEGLDLDPEVKEEDKSEE